MSEKQETPEFIDLLLWVLGAFTRRWRFIFTVTTVACLASVIFVLFIADEEFESTAIITVPASSDAMSGLQGIMDDLGPLSSVLGISMGGGDEAQMLLTMLGSTQMHEALIERFKLDSVYKFKKNPPKPYFKADLLKKFRKSFGAEEDDESGFVVVSMRDKDPNRAREIVEAAVSMVDSSYRELKSRQGKRMRLFYEERMKKNKHELDSLKATMIVFQKRTKIMDPDVQLEESYKGYAALESQKQAIQIELDAERTLHGEGTALGRKLEHQLSAMDQSIDKLRASGSRTGALLSLSNISNQAQEYYTILEEMKIQESIQLVLRKMYEQAVLKEVNDVQSIDVLEKPWANNKRVAPMRRAVVSGVTLAALILCILWAAFLELYFTEKQRGGKRYLKVQEIIGNIRKRNA